MAIDSNFSNQDKLKVALSSITSVGSFDDVHTAFGLLDMPQAQKYGESNATMISRLNSKRLTYV